MNFSIQSIYQWYRQTIRNPKYRWWIILGTCVYLFSPIDIAPDLIPIVGQIDDLAVLTLLIAELSQMSMGWLKSRQDSAGPTVDESSTAQTTVDVDAVPLQD
ncbi:MAG: YkvA family protein [Thermosynechococcaceae cyanobacterium]